MSKVVLINTHEEVGLDPHGVLANILADLELGFRQLGHATERVDPSNVARLAELLRDEDTALFHSFRAHAAGTTVEVNGQAISAFEYFRKPYVSLLANPPYYPGSLRIHETPFPGRAGLVADWDALAYAEAINKSGVALMGTHLCHATTEYDEARADQPTSRRAIPLLYIGTYAPPEPYREQWRAMFAAFPKAVEVIDSVADRAGRDDSTPIWRIFEEHAAASDMRFDIRSTAAAKALDLVTRYATNVIRGRLIRILCEFPATIVTTRLPEGVTPSRHTVMSEPISNRAFLDMLHDTRCLVTVNPQRMSGCISERVLNAMRRGVAVLHTDNSVLRSRDGTAVRLYGRYPEDAKAAISTFLEDPAVGDAMGHAGREMASEFSPRHYAATIWEAGERARRQFAPS